MKEREFFSGVSTADNLPNTPFIVPIFRIFAQNLGL